MWRCRLKTGFRSTIAKICHYPNPSPISMADLRYGGLVAKTDIQLYISCSSSGRGILPFTIIQCSTRCLISDCNYGMFKSFGGTTATSTNILAVYDSPASEDTVMLPKSVWARWKMLSFRLTIISSWSFPETFPLCVAYAHKLCIWCQNWMTMDMAGLPVGFYMLIPGLCWDDTGSFSCEHWTGSLRL